MYTLICRKEEREINEEGKDGGTVEGMKDCRIPGDDVWRKHVDLIFFSSSSRVEGREQGGKARVFNNGVKMRSRRR